MAAIINKINEERDCHILTLEDPIEYLHKHKTSIVNQREIGHDSNSYANALRAALREDPDVILVGEMRDMETISIAITAAETGHLVFSTLHTIGAANTIDRIIDVFPPYQQQQIKVQLSTILQGVISQQLLARRDKHGRAAALEIMIPNPAIRNLIREGKTHQINSIIQTGAKFGMQTMDNSLLNLYRRNIISYEDAMVYAADQENIMRLASI
ncbi:type II secretion system protein E [Pseudobacteroides cellulosolvens ATCC 35603 = DSM 2933]|uniref:Type II secretion system protein E n=1 Tax=Pseudobacteroides cellulosolvens ATCC 35603 = DSM 2933 TaxID=398512 RepID=A0A0L6JMW1_9FIRM|nr:type II secretion system protein E [Pseudobacteroides cellulosolvens ATCC 35603 = DSM 2933]